MTRFGRFLRRRGLGATLGLFSILLAAALGLAVAARTAWHHPLLSNCLWGVVAAIVVCAAICWWKWPKGDDEGPGILVEDSPNAEIRGNIPKEIANKGVAFKRSPGAQVHMNASDEGETNRTDDSGESGDTS